MKKIRLSETELINLIKKTIIKEQEEVIDVDSKNYDEQFAEINEKLDKIVGFVEYEQSIKMRHF
tara:strand:- start:250 stop:441 length:192 start_codon:yes stop_codon:yes gene_type:complete